MSAGWNTIESDAGVFTSLIESLGVQGVQFEELLSLDPAELLALQPLYGVIFLFKYPTNEPYAVAGGPLDGEFDEAASSELFFAAQTIQNACATQALLSVLLNLNPNQGQNQTHTMAAGSGLGAVSIGAELESFREFSMALPPEFRGEALGNSTLIRAAHNSFARSHPFSNELERDANEEGEDVFHFIAYTRVNGVLYELDGLQPAPISHGLCGGAGRGGNGSDRDDSRFAQMVVEVIQRRIARYEQSEIRFNLLAMCGDLRARAREFGDAELLEREEEKRRSWMFENALRRHNFVGFGGEMLRQVVGDVMEKGGDQGVKDWVGQGLERKRAEERAMGVRKGGNDKMEE